MSDWKKTKTAIYILFFTLVCLMCIVKTDGEFSKTERRPLKQFPEITWNSIKSGRFMSSFEEYTLDQFPFRDGFRTLKAWVEQNILQKKNNHEIYVKDGYAVQMVYPENKTSVKNALKVMNGVYETYLKDTECKSYFSMIPDKNYFLKEEAGQLSMDYDLFMNELKKGMGFASYIDITDTLSVEDYYRTDSHWRQEKIVPVARKLNQAMGSSVTGKYKEMTLERPFYGVYHGQWALPLKADKLSYLTNELIEDYDVYDHENGRSIPVYDMEKAAGNDMYETYLNGSLSLITIDNPNINSQKELILFRDSFGSSIAPILAEGYSKVTLVDIRYMRWERLEQFIEFNNQDILFLYSTALLNNNEIR